MKVQELRIGNYVLKEGEEIVITSFTFYNIEKDEYSYEPIQLTEEWLLKFGFERRPWGLIINGLLFRDNIKNPCEVLTLEIGNGFRTEVKHVHQLQNLYFALTGEELTIKE